MFSQAEKGKGIHECGQRPKYVAECLSVWKLFGGMGRLRVWLEDSVLWEKGGGEPARALH